MNWKYILIIFVLAGMVWGGVLWFSSIPVNESGKGESGGKQLLLEKIEEGKEFLFRMMDEEKKGFHKYYYALDDSFEERLHTVYSASIIYTFLHINDLKTDERILENMSGWGNFLLSMQSGDKDERYGAFHYSYFLDTQEREKRFVAGTAALSIFTLLRLYDVTGEEKYLASARMAGDWLTTMHKDDGSIRPYVEYSEGEWVYGQKESLLYNGQVLSGLSKLYGETQEGRYFESAQRIAEYFAGKYEKEQGYIEDEYREKNPISNSWVVMSLMDFCKVNPREDYKRIVFELAEKVLKDQESDGGWGKVYSTSGVGWISEVMVETYRFCREEGREDCEKYKEAALKAMAFLVQNTYSKENSAFLENPERAIGGVFWNAFNKYVRTDSVCHALNSYVRIMDYLEEGD